VGPRVRSIPIYQGGLIVKSATGQPIYTPDILAASSKCKMVTHSLSGNTVRYLYEENLHGQVLKKEYRYTLKGKTVVLEASASMTHSATAFYTGFDFNRSRFTNRPEILDVPPIPFPVIHANKEYYLTTYVDPMLSTTGRYENTRKIINERSVQVTNTPAWLIPGPDGKQPPMKITAYVTISPRITDVLPAGYHTPNTNSKKIASRVVLDLGEFPLARRPLQPVDIIRRWESPVSNDVRLNGTFALLSGESSLCEVHLVEASTGEGHVLYSQNLDPVTKPSAGIEGEFPLSKGDQLLFVCTGPAVLTGGATVLEIALQQGETYYHSADDFSNRQGDRNWYYEQRVGPNRTLMLWNPDRNVWESPIDRSYQSVELSVCRTARLGDAFLDAEAFFDELRRLGLSGFSFLIRDWSEHARFALPNDFVRDKKIWGSAKTLKRMTGKETKAGNLIVDVIPSELLNLPQAPVRSATPMVAPPKNTVKDFLFALSERAATTHKKMTANAAMLESPTFMAMIRDGSMAYYHLLNDTPSASSEAYRIGKEIATGIRSTIGGPILLRWNDRRERLDRFLAPLFDGVMAPNPPSESFHGLVDIDVELARLGVPKIGFGSYRDYDQTAKAADAIDPRLFPFDHYLTSTVAFARTPYLSTRIWYPGFNARDVRRHLTETVSLIQPAAREYLDPHNQTVDIRYDLKDKKSVKAQDMILSGKDDEIEHITIQYSNGLNIFANLSDKPWRVSRETTPKVQIEGNGFFAWNPQTKLTVLIGRSADRSFSVQQTPDTFFLHSRGGGLMTYQTLATDGMVHLWTGTNPSYRNLVCLMATEITRMNPMTPVLRSNARIDCSVQWASKDRVTIEIMEAGSDHTMLEYFDLSPNWLEADAPPLTVQRQREGEAETDFAHSWSKTSSGAHRGLRFTDVWTGDIYTISHQSE